MVWRFIKRKDKRIYGKFSRGMHVMITRKFPKSRKLLLLLGDMALLVFCYCLATAIALKRSMLFPMGALYSGMLPVMVILAGLLFNINGLYSISRKRFAEILLNISVSLFSLFILMMAISFFIREFSYSRQQLLLSICFLWLGLFLWRYIMWRLERALHGGKRKVLLAGSEAECKHVYWRMMQQPQLDLELKYICTDFVADALWKKAVEAVDIVIICSDLRLKDKADLVHYCNRQDKLSLLIPNFYEIFCSGAELDKIDDIPVFRPQSLQPSLEVRSLKRILDIIAAVLGFLCAIPLMLLTAIAIKLDDGGPVLYSQTRVGRYERPFAVYKFRTMKVDAEKHTGPKLAEEHDSRVTRIGRFLRAVRLDELPQIWNVLAGDMSIVGPRPERPFFVEKFKGETPEYVYRHNVKPGITGLAQVYGKYNTTAFDKLVYDLVYIQRCSIFEDLMIIIQTVRVLFTKSATEGVVKQQCMLDLRRFDVRDSYGDF